MNREEKRKVWRKAQSLKDSLWCDTCKHWSLFTAIKADDIDHYDICCIVCGQRKFRCREGEHGITGEGLIHKLKEGKRA